jgi:hypothetical protein
MTTSRDCSTCHSYPDWNLVNFRHQSVLYPGQHRAASSCEQCHATRTEAVAFTAPAQSGTCGACHAKDFKPDAHPKTAKGQLYLESELSDCTGACHVYSDETRSSVTRSVRGPHHRVTDAAFHH